MLMQGLEIGGLWLTFLSGTYFAYYNISYMRQKPLGHQTLLDVLYSQLFLLGLVSGFWTTIAFTLIAIGHESWVAGLIFGYGSLTLIYAMWIHLMLCGFIRLLMVLYPESIQDVPDSKIQQKTW